MKILFASQIEPADRWLPLLKSALPRDDFLLEPKGEVDVALVASPPQGTLEKLKSAKNKPGTFGALLDASEVPR